MFHRNESIQTRLTRLSCVHIVWTKGGTVMWAMSIRRSGGCDFWPLGRKSQYSSTSRLEVPDSFPIAQTHSPTTFVVRSNQRIFAIN